MLSNHLKLMVLLLLKFDTRSSPVQVKVLGILMALPKVRHNTHAGAT
jgi:hypothetical protein